MNILIQKSVCGLLAVALLLTIAFSFGQPVQAQSTSSQQTQIETLLALIAQLQARLAEMQQTTVQTTSEGGFSEKDIQIGNRVQTTDNLRLRTSAQLSAPQIAVASPFTGGTVMSGPITNDGYTWWNVQYDNGLRAWSVQNWLISVTDYGRSVARNTPIDGTGFIDDSVDWREDMDDEVVVNEKQTALDTLKEAQDEVEDILDEYYEDYEDKAEKLNREDDAQALINTFNFQLEFAEDAYADDDYQSTISFAESTMRHVARLEEFLENLEDSDYTFINELPEPSIDRFVAAVSDESSYSTMDDIHGPFINLSWKTTWTGHCSLDYEDYNLFKMGEWGTRTTYSLGRASIENKFGLTEFPEVNEFTLRCKSAIQDEDDEFPILEKSVRVRMDDSNDSSDESSPEQEPELLSRSEVCPFTWTRTMSSGSTGSDVSLLKKFLNTDPDTAVRYNNGFSSNYDSSLEQAINKFQVKYRSSILSPLGLVNPTGEFDAATMAKTNSLCIN